MIIPIIFTILGVIYFGKIAKELKKEDIRFQYININDWRFFSGMFCFLIGMGIALLLPGDMNRIETNYELLNVRDNRDIDGHFGVFGGDINTETYYYFYIEQDGILEQIKIKDTDIEIIINDSIDKPIYTHIEYELTNNPINFIAIDLPYEVNLLTISKDHIDKSYILDNE